MQFEAKREEFEYFLTRLNRTVAAEFGEYPSDANSPLLTGQIVGLPRSGTTILYQLLARTGAVGYPSNVLAFFWQAPTVGAMLQQQLAKTEPTLSLNSLAGRTSEPLDPHEFGYFWRTALGHSTNSTTVDLAPWSWKKIQDTLDAMTATFERPVVYKNFLALSHASEMRDHLTRQRYLVLERSLIDIAASLLNVRRHIGIASHADFGLTVESTRTGSHDSALKRVVSQVADLESLIRQSGFDRDPNALIIQYADLCARPRDVVADALSFLGAEVDNLNDAVPDELPGGRGASTLDSAERDNLHRLLETELQ